MAWLELTVRTASAGIERAANLLTAGGFEDLVLEDQAEFEEFLDQNRAYWDYIDEELEQSLQGLSNIKLYLENTDTAGLQRLKELLVTNARERFGIPLDDCWSVWDLNAEYTVDPNAFLSKGRATPLTGRKLCGKHLLTVHNGNIVLNYLA